MRGIRLWVTLACCILNALFAISPNRVLGQTRSNAEFDSDTILLFVDCNPNCPRVSDAIVLDCNPNCREPSDQTKRRLADCDQNCANIQKAEAALNGLGMVVHDDQRSLRTKNGSLMTIFSLVPGDTLEKQLNASGATCFPKCFGGLLSNSDLASSLDPSTKALMSGTDSLYTESGDAVHTVPILLNTRQRQ